MFQIKSKFGVQGTPSRLPETSSVRELLTRTSSEDFSDFRRCDSRVKCVTKNFEDGLHLCRGGESKTTDSFSIPVYIEVSLFLSVRIAYRSPLLTLTN